MEEDNFNTSLGGRPHDDFSGKNIWGKFSAAACLISRTCKGI